MKKSYRYFDVIMAFFVAVLIISNIASTKLTSFWGLTFDAGTLLFPLSYIFGDILTEVYGYEHSRRVIWTGFFSLVLMSLVLMIVTALPPAPDWPYDEVFKKIIGLTPRIALASLIAFFAGEFSNSYIMAKMKILFKGKSLWVRTIGSTFVGEGVDTLLFVVIAFFGVFPSDVLVTIIVSNYIFKVSVEILFTPITYRVVSFLKSKEREDYYDTKTNFNPFLIR